MRLQERWKWRKFRKGLRKISRLLKKIKGDPTCKGKPIVITYKSIKDSPTRGEKKENRKPYLLIIDDLEPRNPDIYGDLTFSEASKLQDPEKTELNDPELSINPETGNIGFDITQEEIECAALNLKLKCDQCGKYPKLNFNGESRGPFFAHKNYEEMKKAVLSGEIVFYTCDCGRTTDIEPKHFEEEK